MNCIKCNSEHIQKDGNHNGFQRYKCLDCKKRFDYGKYENKIEYITHFNTKIRKTNHNKLSRENYCVPTNRISYVCRKSLKFYIERIGYKIPDEYKQVYIGISNDIKRRILRHWSDKKDFDRLLFGDKEKSILSIDSFGALDTTRIFYKEFSYFNDIYSAEYNVVDKFKAKYKLNRVDGGINSEEDSTIRNLELRGTMAKREFK